MKYSFTSIVYFPITIAIAIIAYRYYKEWRENNKEDSLFYFLAFATLSLVCSTGVFTGTILPDKEGIILMLIVSNYLVALSNGFFAYIYVYYRFHKISPWWGFSIVFGFGIFVTVLMELNQLTPALEPSGGVNWGVPIWIGALRGVNYMLGMVPLMTVLYRQLRATEDRMIITNNLFLMLFFTLPLIVVVFDFVIEPWLNILALFSEVVILILLILGMLIFFIFYERALSKTQKRFKHLVDNMLDLGCLTDANGIIQYANLIHETILGYKPSDLKGKEILEIVHPEDRDAVKETLLSLKSEMTREGFEFRFIHAEERLIWVETFGSFLLDEEASFADESFIVIASRDITERKSLEESLRQSQKMEAVGLLAGGIAHDFNNLLTVINGYTDIMLSKIDKDDALFKYLQQVKKSGKRASGLTRQLLAFSRKQILEPEVININDLIFDMGKMLRRLVREDIDMVTKCDPDLKPVQADPGQIEQVILNLVVNASDAMLSGGKLTIETRNTYFDEYNVKKKSVPKAGEYVMMAVTDTGIGIDKETRERIFEPFFTTKEKGKGTGLGLATVYGIIKQSQGNILVYSEPGRGTTFKVYLPVTESSDNKKKQTKPEEEYTGKETILIIEDDDAVRTMAKEGLSDLGYNVYDVPDGSDGLELVKQNHKTFDLLLTDVVMPNMSGREIAEKVVSYIPDIKVLYMSGYTDNAIVHHGVLEKGINFIQKPFTIVTLAKKIRQALADA